MVSVRKSNKKRIPLIIISSVFFFCVVSLTVTKFIYDAIFTRYDDFADIPQPLSAMVETRQVCSFPSGENLLTGYFYDSGEKHGLVVLVPGFHAGGDDYLWQISDLVSRGWGVFSFDPTGTLRSQGDSQVGFSQVISDLNAALKYVENSQRFGYNEIVLLGHSRGAYAACCALAQAQDVAAVVSVSAMDSAMQCIMQRSVDTVGYLSYGNYGFLWLYQAMLFGADTVNLQASKVISERDVPVLVIHGTKDDNVPVDSGSVISQKDRIASGKVEYLLCDAGHTDLMYDDDGTENDALMEEIHNFLIRSLGI